MGNSAYGAFAQREPIIDTVHAPHRRGRASEYALPVARGASDELITLTALGERIRAGITHTTEGAEGLADFRAYYFPDKYGKLNMQGFEGSDGRV